MANTFWLPFVNKSDKPALRQFGLGFSAALIIFFMLLIPWLAERSVPVWPLWVAGLMTLLALGYPTALYYPCRVWIVIASLLNFINTRIILLLVFFVLITPVGILRRVLGRPAYSRKPSADANTYWQRRTDTPDRQRLKEPF